MTDTIETTATIDPIITDSTVEDAVITDENTVTVEAPEASPAPAETTMSQAADRVKAKRAARVKGEAPAAPVPSAPSPAPVLRSLAVSALVTDPRAQPRVSMDSALISEYAEDMKAGASFPPVVVYGNTKNAYVGDGFHRVAAAREAGLSKIQVELRKGGIDEAILHSLGANGQHGARRSNADKRNAVERALALMPDRTDGVIADTCAVSARFVSTMRAEAATKNGSESAAPTARVGRDGRVTNVTNIGKGRRAASSAPAADDFQAEGSQEAPDTGTYSCGDCGEPCDAQGHDHSNAAPGATVSAPRIPTEPNGTAITAPSTLGDAAAEILANVPQGEAPATANEPTAGAVYDTMTRLARGIKSFPSLDPEAVAAESMNPAQALEVHTAALAFYGRFVAALNARAKANVRSKLSAAAQ